MKSLWLALASFAIGFPSSANAFSFSPSVMEFTLGEKQPSRTFTAENTGDSKVAVQISAHSRAVDENGVETLPTTSDFNVFPKQLILGPRESRTVRVTYKGPATLEREAAYRIVAEQLPVDLKAVEPAPGTRLKFLIKYQTSVYVRAATAKPKVSITSARALEEAGRERQLELIFRNDGTAHRILERARVTISSETKASGKPVSASLDAEATKILETVNVLAGSQRRVIVAWPKSFPPGPLSARLDLD